MITSAVLAVTENRWTRKLITETYTNIQQQNFYRGCGEPKCTWCQFAKENAVWADLSNPEEEALDDL